MTAMPDTRTNAQHTAADHADRFVDAFGRRHHIPGMSIAIVDAHGLLHTSACGFRDLANRSPATPTTSYLWFSLTKIATATAARQLADSGRLDLTAPVTDYVDLGPKHRSPIPSVGQLLNHTAGFANPLPTRWVRGAAAPSSAPEVLLDRLLHKHGKPKHPVGGKAFYSNLGYLVLGEVISRAANQPFTEYLTEAVLQPTGMTHTGFTHRHDAVAATPYVRVRRPLGPLLNLLFPHDLIGRRTGSYLALNPFYVEGASYGGLVGTVADAGRFASMHLADGTVDGRQIITGGAARQMRDITTEGARDFGQGWFRAAGHRDLQPAYAEHLGAGGGFYNAMRIYPDLDLGIVTMANTTSSYPHHDLFTEIANLDWHE